MKPLKTQKHYLYQKIRDNSALIKVSNKEKAKELTKQNEALQLQLTELKLMKHL